MNVCPTPSTDADYRKLYTLLGGDAEGDAAKEQALKSSYRMWRAHEDLDPGNGSVSALKTFTATPTDKLAIVNKYAKNLTLDKVSHTYSWAGDSSILIQSVSSMLDDVLETPYKKGTRESIYSESGTTIHDLFNKIVTIGDPESENIKKFADDKKIPASLITDLFTLKDTLSKMGTLASEQVVYAEGTTEDVRLAGTADVVIYGADGRKYIVDLKTVYNTEALRKKGEAPWDPLAHNAQKAKRYTAQTMAYGRMTEWADRQAVTDHFIVPIELEMNDDNDLSAGYKSTKMHPMTSVLEWKATDYATRVLDKVFGVSSTAPSTDGIMGTDDSSKVYETLTGDIGIEMNPEDTARKLARGTQTIMGRSVYGYFEPGNEKFHPFNNQTDPAAQVQQIVNDYVNKRGRMNADLGMGIKNYIESGDSRFLKSIGDRRETLIRLLGQFRQRRDINVINLTDIKGFEEKRNWILIEDGSNRHLFYITAEDLRKRFDTSKTRVGPKSSTSLFGRLAGENRTDHTINSALQNTIGDARAFEGTLIAMKLKESNPDIRFGMTMIQGLTGSGFASMIDLKENLETVANLKNDPVFRRSGLFSPDLLTLVNKPGALDYKNYRADFLEMLGKYMDFRQDDPTLSTDLSELVAAIRTVPKDASDRKAILEAIAEHLNSHVRMGRTVDTNYETYLLSAYYTQMQEMDISLLPIGRYRAWGGMPQNITNPMLQQVNKQLNVAINKMSSEFHSEYKDEFSKVLDKYLSSKGLSSAAYDIATGNTVRHYEELFETITREVHTEDGGKKTVTLPSFNLKREDGAEFNALSPEAQALIRLMNKTIAKFTDKSGIKWVKGHMPLVRASVANRLRNVKRTGGSKAYSEAINTMLIDLEASFGAGEDTDPISDNIFAAQWSDEISDSREGFMGLQSDGYINLELYHKWSTDIESMMDVFAIQGLKHETFAKVGATMRAVNSIFQWFSSNLMEENLGTDIDWINMVKTVNLDNRDIDANTPLNRGARLVTRVASMGLYGLNPITASSAWLGNELTTLSESIANSIAGTGRFKLSSLNKAKVIMGGFFGKRAFEKLTASNLDALEKTNLLMRRFRMFNEDITSLLNGYHKTGDKFLFRSKYLFSMLNAGDYASRMNIMIAQLLEDGSWDAYSVENGKLVYDESKDEQYNGRGKNTKEQSAALRSVVAANLGLSPGDKLTFGHDDNMGDSIRGLSNYLLGTNDREARAMMNFVWWGKIFGASKNWLAAKIDRWTLGLGDKRIEESALTGQYVYDKDKDGNVYAFWKGDPMEGIIVSWLALIDNIRHAKEDRVPLNSTQKNNIVRSLSDLVLVAMISAITAGITDDDKTTKGDDLAARIIAHASDDLLVLYSLAKDPKFLWTPISLEYMLKLSQNTFKAVVNVDPERLFKNTSISTQLNDLYNTTHDEDFELTEK